MSSQNISVAKRFGEHLRSARVQAGETQEGLAQHMAAKGFHWGQTTVTKTENGSRPLLLDEFVALCQVLNQAPGFILTMLTGPAIPRAVQVAEVRARIAGKRRDLEDARDAVERSHDELSQLMARLEVLEADDS